MKKKLFASVFFLLFIFLFLNFGKWLDVTEKPPKSDIIVCLGGGTVERLKKSIELYEEGYASGDVLLQIGESLQNQPYIAMHNPDISIKTYKDPKNTKAEIEFIKNYMKKYSYKSALIVTDPPHTRRVSILISLVSIPGEEGMHFHMIGSEVKWWDAAYYYTNQRSLAAAVHEGIGILYSVITYGIFEKIGLLNGAVDRFEAWREGEKI